MKIMGKLKLNFVHVCENAFLSKDNKLNIIGIFNKILSFGFPAIHPKLFIVTNISGELSEFKEAIEIVSPNNKVIVNAENQIKIDENKSANFIAQFVGIPFENEGIYKIRILVDGIIINEDNFIILRRKEEYAK